MPCVKASGSWGRTESTFTASRSAGRAIKGGGACGSGAEAERRSQNETTARISVAMTRIMGQRRVERTGGGGCLDFALGFLRAMALPAPRTIVQAAHVRHPDRLPGRRRQGLGEPGLSVAYRAVQIAPDLRREEGQMRLVLRRIRALPHELAGERAQLFVHASPHAGRGLVVAREADEAA